MKHYKSIYLLGQCKHCGSLNTKTVDAIIKESDLAPGTCESCGAEANVFWERFAVRHHKFRKKKWMWIALAVLAALLLCLSAAIFIPKRYSSTDILLAKERVERKSSAELLKTVPGLRMKCQQQLGLSPLCIKQLMEGAPATPLADSLIRALACQRVLDGWLFYYKRYYPLSPFAIQAEDALEASVAAGD